MIWFILSKVFQFRYCRIPSFIPIRNAFNTIEYEMCELLYGIVLSSFKEGFLPNISRDFSIFCSSVRKLSFSSTPSVFSTRKWCRESWISFFARFWNSSGLWKRMFIWSQNCSQKISLRREYNSLRSSEFSRIFGVSWIFSMVKMTRVDNRIIKDTKVKFLFWLLFRIFKIEYSYTFLFIIMIWNLLSHVFRGLSIYRWNTFPRLREISSLDHLAFVAHVAVTLASIIEEKEWKKYNTGLLLRKILWSGFFTFQYSDISSELKYRLKKHSPHLYTLLEDNVYHSLLDMDIPDRLKTDIALIQQPTPEDEIIAFSKAWAGYYEVYHNSLVYKDAYAPLLENIRLRVIEEWGERFFDYLDLEPTNQTDVEKYLVTIHRLASSYRWNLVQRIQPVSVLSHTYIITFFSYLIGILEEKNDEEITDMLLIALFHDIPEVITGDVITPTKQAVPWLEKAIGEIEVTMVHDYLLGYLSEYNFSKAFAERMLHPWDMKNGKLVKLADTFSALFEALIESGRSPTFKETYKSIKKKLYTYEYKSVDYILKYGIGYFEN